MTSSRQVFHTGWEVQAWLTGRCAIEWARRGWKSRDVLGGCTRERNKKDKHQTHTKGYTERNKKDKHQTHTKGYTERKKKDKHQTHTKGYTERNKKDKQTHTKGYTERKHFHLLLGEKQVILTKSSMLIPCDA